MTWPELARDLDRALEPDQSTLFRLIYENEFGSPGGEPFGLLVVDHEVCHLRSRRDATATHAPVDDVSVMACLAVVANAAFVPTVLGAAPELLGVSEFEELALSLDPPAAMRTPDYARWHAATARPEFRFLGLTMPRVLARVPWIPHPLRAEGFAYREHAPHRRDRCWCIGGYAFAAIVSRAYGQSGWPADISGVTLDAIRGSLVLDLPAEAYPEGAVVRQRRQALDLLLTDGQERALVRAGFMPLNALPFGGEVLVVSVGSLQSPVQDEQGREASVRAVNTGLSAQLSSMLCVSRFAHYIKIMGRDFVGSHLGTEEIQNRLQSWLLTYTNSNDNAGPDMRARFPLFLSGVQVREEEGRPGTFGCVIHLQPHYQLDEVATTFRLTTTLSGVGARQDLS